MRKIGYLILGCFCVIQLNAQTEIDALRYSQQNIFGTAKFSSMAGSFGALGGEFSSLSYNPASIAFYQNSELTLTNNSYINKQVIQNSDDSVSMGNFDSKIGSSLSNFGFVVNGKDYDDWKRINFGFGWNQLANYDKIHAAEAKNNGSSLATIFLNSAQGNMIDELDPFSTKIAFWSDLIDLSDTSNNWSNDNGTYISHVNPALNKDQSQKTISEGNMGEFVISMGGAYQERIYIGATIAIPTIWYSETSVYSEEGFKYMPNDTISYNDTTSYIIDKDNEYGISGFNYTEELLASGSGINLKIGAIVRIGENSKIGGSIHTPSYIEMQEEYTMSISTDWHNIPDPITEYSPRGMWEYVIITPWKITGSLSTMLNKRFLINADIEQTDYGFTRMYSEYEDEGWLANQNGKINDLYVSATNIRIGGEANFHPFSIRAGYGIYGSPLKDKPEYKTENYSLGLGINLGKTFIDMSYVNSLTKSEYTMYNNETNPSSVIDTEKHRLFLTLGVRL